MPSTNFGSSAIWYHRNDRFREYVGPQGSNGFFLGLNSPYGGGARPPKLWELMALDSGERVDDWNHGAAWRPSARPGMALCIGAARSGKGAGIIIPALLNYTGNVVVNDPKGENFWITGERRRKQAGEGGLGKKTVLADPFGTVNREYGSMVNVFEKVTRYNPLAELDPASPDFPEDVAAIGDALTIEMSGGDNSNFFSGSSRDMIDGLIAATVTDAAPGRGTLRNVRQWLNLDNATFGALVQDFCDRFPNSLGAAKLRHFSDMTDRTNIGVKATAKQQTVFLDSEQLLQYMEPAVGEETFSFTELCTGKLDVYLCLPATHTNSYKRWMRMMVNQSMRAVLRTGVRDLGLPVMYFLDEAGTTLGHLDAIENAYGLTSGMGLSCWSFYQDISQLKRDYPHSWQTFIANSATIQLMRVGDLETAKYFSEHFGQMTLTTVSTSTSARGGVAGQPGDNTQSTSYGEAGRAVLTHDEVMRISDKEMIVLDARMPPVQLYQVRYFSDARFNGLYRPDPKRQQTFPSAIEEPPHVAPGKQGWWINFKLANGGGNGYATYTRPFSLLRLLKFGALATAAVILAFAMFSYFSMDRVESPHAVQQTKTTKIQPAQQAKMDTFTAKLTALAKPPADVIKAVEERATSQSRLSHQAGWNYTSNLYDLGVQAPGESTMTVVGIEDCDDGKTGIEAARWRNVAFLLTKSPDGSWQVKEMAASTGYATKQALIFADATYPKSDVTPTPLPDKLP